MKLRARKSEYQRCFASPSKEYSQNVYEEQLTYRQKRREKENGQLLLQWDSESSDGNSDKKSIEEETKDKLEMDQASADDQEIVERLSGNADGDNSDSVKPLDDHEDQENKDVNQNTEKRSRSAKRSCSRAKSKSRERSTEKPPFLSYGWADKQIETGRKRTHNIQAPKKSVYPAALKRLNYLTLEKLKQKQKSESRASTALSVQLCQKKQSDSSVWLTEYQRCYSSQSSRPGTAQSRKKSTGRKSRNNFVQRKKT